MNPMKKNNLLYTIVFAFLLLVSIVATNIMTNVYGQEDGDIETDNEISLNESVPLIGNLNDTSMSNLSEPGVEEFENITTPLVGNESFDTTNESLLTEEESFDTTNESLLTEEESFDTTNESMSTEEDAEVENGLPNENVTAGTEMTEPLDNASELVLEDDGDNFTQAQQGLTPNIAQKLETAAAAIVGVTNATGGVENEQITNVQQVINNIAFAGSQSGGDINALVNQISQLVASNPNSPVAVAIKKLAEEYSNGNIDEIDLATQQIGTQIAQGKNIQQILVQVTNNVVNNIKNVKTSIENYDKIIVHPNTLDVDKNIITETITTIKKSKTTVDVPRIHIKFDDDEKNLVLRVLNTNDAKYEMPFSKTKGGFRLDSDEFQVKVTGGKGKIQAASMAEMLGDGKVGDKEFLDKERKNGKVYFNLDEIEAGKYLLEIYIKLSDSSIGTWARGSVTVTK
jgi:hypothetical protein